jgi:hypothetical protein
VQGFSTYLLVDNTINLNSLLFNYQRIGQINLKKIKEKVKRRLQTQVLKTYKLKLINEIDKEVWVVGSNAFSQTMHGSITTLNLVIFNTLKSVLRW